MVQVAFTVDGSILELVTFHTVIKWKFSPRVKVIINFCIN